MINETQMLNWMWKIEHDDTFYISEITKDVIAFMQIHDVI